MGLVTVNFEKKTERKKMRRVSPKLFSFLRVCLDTIYFVEIEKLLLKVF